MQKTVSQSPIFFFPGVSADLTDVDNPDWVPTQNLGYSTSKTPNVKATDRYLRTKKRAERVVTSTDNSKTKTKVTANKVTIPKILSDGLTSAGPPKKMKTKTKVTETDEVTVQIISNNAERALTCERAQTNTNDLETEIPIPIILNDAETDDTERLTIEMIDVECKFFEKSSQTNIEGHEFENQIEHLKSIILNYDITLESFENDDVKTCFFTGISKFQIMKAIYLRIEKDLPVSKSLSKFKIFYITLVRMRLNQSFTYLAYRFRVSRDTISKYWHKGLAVLYSRIRGVIYFPERDILKFTMPPAFQKAFGDKVSIILDCFGIFIE